MKRVLLLMAALFALLVPGVSFAQGAPPSLSVNVQPRDVEVGEPFAVTLTATVDPSAPSPSDPRLPLPDGLRAGSASVVTQMQFGMGTGSGLTSHKGITATWQVVASREGAFVIGPPSVTWDGRIVQAKAMRVVVHPASPGGRQRHASPSPNPLDPFGGMFPRLPGIFESPEPQAEPPPDPELALDAPLDSQVFLRSIVDRKNPVVGEQVTFTVYQYSRILGLEPSDVHEPSIPDFYRHELQDQQSPRNALSEARTVSIGGVSWRAMPLYKSALFPLKSGEIVIGPMNATYGRAAGGTTTRSSQPVKLSVSEPPSNGRPVGYMIGDVGNYTLTATVDPRKSMVGGAVAVKVTLAGVGNVPTTVKMPMSSAFEWLEPQTRENWGTESGGKISGSRTFSYVARPKTAGTVELGDVTLPYWNPERKVYDIARAYLGKIEVSPDPTQAASRDPAPPRDPWASLAKERDRPGGYKRASEPLTERPFYWLGLFGAPLAVVASSLGSRGLRRLHARFMARRRSTERGIDLALAEARALARSDAPSAALGPLERALYLSIERATALKARALLIDDIPAELEGRGVAAALAVEIQAALAAVEAARFAPEGQASGRSGSPPAGQVSDRSGSPPAGQASGLFEKVTAVVRKLGRLPPLAKG